MSAVDEAARLLATARASGRPLDALPASCRPSSLEDAYAIQQATTELAGDSIAGWKVGTTPEGLLAHGGLLRSRILADGSQVAATLVPLLGVEAEIAFRLDRALPPRPQEYTYEEVAESVTALPAIEVVDSRFRGYPNVPFLDRTADFMSNGAFIRGEPRADWRRHDLVSLDAELTIDGRTIVRCTGGHPAKDPLLPAVALVNELRARSGIDAGMIITTGTYTGLQFAKPGNTIVATFHGFGSASVHFGEAP